MLGLWDNLFHLFKFYLEGLYDDEGLYGDEGVLTGDAVHSRAAGVWRSDSIAAPVIVRPATTADVSLVLRSCHEARQSVVTHAMS